MGLLLALITYVGWGAGDIFGVIAARKIGSYQASAWIYTFSFLIASLYLPFAWQDLKLVTPGLLAINIIAGIGFTMGNFFISEGFRRSNASLVGLIVQAFPAIVLILSALIFNDPLTTKQILWTLVIFVGVSLCTVNFKDFKNSDLIKDFGIRLALMAALIFSLFFTFSRVFTDVYGWFLPYYICFATFPITLFLIRKLFNVKEKIVVPKKISVLVVTACCALFLRSGDLALGFGVDGGLASTVTPIASASPTLFIFLSSLFFKDPVSRQQKIGIVICLAGIVLLSFVK